MKTSAQTRAILEKLEAQHPNAQTELNYESPFQLLVATILSAQTTDQRVNQVTPELFARYPDAKALGAADISDVERLIHATGFYAQKARSLVGMATALADQHGGAVPADMSALVRLPGVGRKTANVVLGHALGVPGLAVDRHVLRVANRTGIAASEDPQVVEQQLCAALPKEKWTLTSDTLILHGRRICKPQPLCDRCAVRSDCDFFRHGLAATLSPAARRAKPPARPPSRRATKKAASPGTRAARKPAPGPRAGTKTGRKKAAPRRRGR